MGNIFISTARISRASAFLNTKLDGRSSYATCEEYDPPPTTPLTMSPALPHPPAWFFHCIPTPPQSVVLVPGNYFLGP